MFNALIKRESTRLLSTEAGFVPEHPVNWAWWYMPIDSTTEVEGKD